jgi:two-component system sensor histidine kinase DesK
VITHGIVRVVAAVAIILTVWLSIADALQLAFSCVFADTGATCGPAGKAGHLGALILAITLAIPLHVRHLIYGVRGERPPWGAWTLAALAIVTAVGAFLAGGGGWMRELAPLAVSTLIVVPGFWGVVLASAIAVVPIFVIGAGWYAGDPPLPGIYFTFAVVWRTATQFLPLKLLAALRALDLANHELETRAVVQMRARIDIDLRGSVRQTLERIIARGEVAHAAAQNDSARAVDELRQLVGESRRGLAEARRMVTGYRASSVRAELDVAAALLEASGARVRVVGADDALLDSPDEPARRAIRAAIADALRSEPHSSYCLEVIRDPKGTLDVKVTPDDELVSVARGTA